MGEGSFEILTISEAKDLLRREKKYRFADRTLQLIASMVEPIVAVEGEEAREKPLEAPPPDKTFLSEYVERIVGETREAEKKRIRFSVVQKRALEHYLDAFSKLDLKSSRELREKLISLGFVPEHVAVSIVNNLPQTPLEVRIHFGREGALISDEDVRRILDLIAMYV